jgi:hypothetical protein
MAKISSILADFNESYESRLNIDEKFNQDMNALSELVSQIMKIGTKKICNKKPKTYTKVSKT